ncbi:MAG: hypothetical protein Q4C59_07415, partial [Lachnospiraceae bacterium]|nr:hypothetical protein [Lachnospiraceae bacterium]
HAVITKTIISICRYQIFSGNLKKYLPGEAACMVLYNYNSFIDGWLILLEQLNCTLNYCGAVLFCSKKITYSYVFLHFTTSDVSGNRKELLYENSRSAKTDSA